MENYGVAIPMRKKLSNIFIERSSNWKSSIILGLTIEIVFYL